MLNNPIFIGGEGRSGTTLLSLILNSHSQLAFGPELHFRAPKNLYKYILSGIDFINYKDIDEDLMLSVRGSDIHQSINFIKRCHRFGVSPKELKDIICKNKYKLTDGVSFYERSLIVNSIGEYVRIKQNKSLWGIKIMRDLTLSSKYLKNWPDSVFIHIIRDGRDVASSQLNDHKGWGYKDIHTAAEQWSSFIKNARTKNKENKYFEIRYEDLILDTENCLRLLFSYLGLSWEYNVLDYYIKPQSLLDNPYDHPSSNSISKPLTKSAIGRYKRQMNSEDLRKYNSIAGDVLNDLNYIR